MDLSGNHGQQLPEHAAAMHSKAVANGDLGFEMVSSSQGAAKAAAGASSFFQVSHRCFTEEWSIMKSSLS
jgi:hypothetical protein